MAFCRSNAIRNVLRLTQRYQNPNYSFASFRSYSNATLTGNGANTWRKCDTLFMIRGSLLPHDSSMVLRSTIAAELSSFLDKARPMSTKVKPSPQMRQTGSAQVAMVSPGIVYEPYGPRPPISFWRRLFTRDGWKRTKEDMILEDLRVIHIPGKPGKNSPLLSFTLNFVPSDIFLFKLKNAYAIAKLRKIGYKKKVFYCEAFEIYKEMNKLIADGDKTSLRKLVTENMFSGPKNEIKQREAVWKKVHWELIEPSVNIRILRARLIGVDRNNLNKVFIQLTLEILTKQKFEAYDYKDKVVAGDKNKEVLVRDIWVFEKSLFHQGAYWRLCGRLPSS